MSIEQLREDFKTVAEDVNKLGPLASVTDIVSFLNNTLVPFVASAVEELTDLDGCVGDLLEGTDDILQPETAKLFAALIVGGVALAGKLRELSPPGKDPQLDAALVEYEKLCAKSQEVLTEIVVASDEEDEDDDEGEGEEDDEGDEDEDEDEDDTEGNT